MVPVYDALPSEHLKFVLQPFCEMMQVSGPHAPRVVHVPAMFSHAPAGAAEAVGVAAVLFGAAVATVVAGAVAVSAGAVSAGVATGAADAVALAAAAPLSAPDNPWSLSQPKSPNERTRRARTIRRHVMPKA